ncbi:MAG TPA: four helix bundle protein [Gemmatimonadales bacterium]|nr:four helix bundle protein [Gemmatimonadales bacterium]
MGDYRSLRVWKAAYQLTLAVYRATADFPREERFGLTSQSRRAALSIASNIAEGASRGTAKDFTRFLWIARGSCAELHTQLLLAVDLGYLPEACGVNLSREADRVGAMLMALLKSRGAAPSRDDPP